MPIMFISSAEGTFDQSAKDIIAAQLTDLGAECERLARTDFVRSTTFVHFNDLPPGNIYHSGRKATAKIATLLVNVLEGGFDATAKEVFMERATKILGNASGQNDRVPAYVIFRDISNTSLALFGATATLKDLREPDPNAKPI
jgi:phenylpyruvate tautomerase PptA (4-oxalocrotonate tautomerase family)